MASSNKIIDVLVENSFEIYDALLNKKISVSKLYNDLKQKNKKELGKYKKLPDTKLNKYMNLDKYTILDDILYLTNNRYKHLKGIRDVVNLERFINYILPNGKNETYIKKCKIYYSNLIIDKILESYYDYDDIKLLSSYKEELIVLEQHINTDITEKINDYYIKLITN